MKDVHNNADLAVQLADLLLEFSTTTQREFEQVSGLIEDGRQKGILEDTVYEEIVKTAKFEIAYQELVENNCMDLATRMHSYLYELSKKMLEYNNIKI